MARLCAGFRCSRFAVRRSLFPRRFEFYTSNLQAEIRRDKRLADEILRGLLTPDRFLKNAEEINALATIDAHVLEQALADRLSWAARGLIVPKISVNVSSRRLRDGQLIKSLKDLAIAPGQIAFELLESIYLDDDDKVIARNIRRLKSLGIDIEIDDFGTGPTSIFSLLSWSPSASR